MSQAEGPNTQSCEGNPEDRLVALLHHITVAVLSEAFYFPQNGSKPPTPVGKERKVRRRRSIRQPSLPDNHVLGGWLRGRTRRLCTYLKVSQTSAVYQYAETAHPGGAPQRMRNPDILKRASVLRLIGALLD